jgi:hypothetical protein
LLGLAALAGLPISIWLAGFLTIPLGLLQIWQMKRISDGRKPNWNNLVITAALLFAASSYFLAYAFWTY